MRHLILLLLAIFLLGCNVEDIPPAHRAWVFEESVFGGTEGFQGPILGPGSHSIGVGNSYRMLQCSESTVREQFKSPAKDGVEFGTDIYVRYAANCDEDDAVKWIFKNVQPNPKLAETLAQEADKDKKDAKSSGEAPVDEKRADKTVTSYQLHATYLRPLVGEAVRDAISGYPSDEINLRRDEIAKKLSASLNEKLAKTFDDAQRPRIIKVYEITLSKIDFPDKMMELNQQLANKKTEIAIENESKKKVEAEIATEKMRKDLEQVKTMKSVQEIDLLGEVLRANPEYLEYLRVKQMPETVGALGKNGGTLVFGQMPDFFMNTGSSKKD